MTGAQDDDNDNDNDNEDAIEILDPTQDFVDMRRFPEKVFDFVNTESVDNPETVQWISNGEAFALGHNEELPFLLNKHFGCKSWYSTPAPLL
jgi:hypothetical protein